MAEIKMELSEYERLMENKTLLEKSLESERKLQDEYKQLQSKLEEAHNEKLKILEEGKYVVNKINTTTITEHKLLIKELSRYQRDELCYILQQGDINKIDSALRNVFNTVTSHGNNTYIKTSHSLDDVKQEIRLELESQFKEDLSKLSKLNNDISELTNTNKSLTDRVDNLVKMYQDSTDNNTNLSAKIKELEEMITKINNVLSEEALFNKGNILNNIRRIINYDKT